jgi:hypothetical protein
MPPIDFDKLLGILNDPSSETDLVKYFGTDLVADAPPRFTGARFETLDGGGDRDDIAHRITASDLLAVEMLSVSVPRRVAIDLLEGDLGRSISEALKVVPTNLDIGAAGAEGFLADGGEADKAWEELVAQDGVGWVTAGKLLARKRPRLIPVYDEIVWCAYGRPPHGTFWLWLNNQFVERSGALPARLKGLHSLAGLPTTVSPLRVLDVVIWMRHRDEHVGTRCPGIARGS